MFYKFDNFINKYANSQLFALVQNKIHKKDVFEVINSKKNYMSSKILSHIQVCYCHLDNNINHLCIDNKKNCLDIYAYNIEKKNL